VAWRILDARYFGVPQRRRRVFIVARRADSLADTPAASRLALRALVESGSGYPTPGWPPRQDAPGSVGAGAPSSSGEPIAFYYSGGGNDAPSVDGVSPTVKKGSALEIGSPPAIAYRKSKRAQTDQDDETWVDDGAANTLNRFDLGDTRTTHLVANALDRQAGGPDDNAAQANHLIPADMTVRRLTPVECERLMGLPDNWTAPEGVKAPDSKRYAACGDAIVSWVAYWIGQRIRMIEEEN
jgi:DNA (cytosine-5)-methyltransferase 1